MILATHADADHTQGPGSGPGHPQVPGLRPPQERRPRSKQGDEIMTYARIDAQNIHIDMPRCKVDQARSTRGMS